MKNKNLKVAINNYTQSNPTSIDKLVDLLRSDTIIIPKEIMKLTDVYEETKIMFAVVFTECLKQTTDITDNTVSDIKKKMKNLINNISSDEIRYECCCSESKVPIIREEMLTLLDTVNISKCLNERK